MKLLHTADWHLGATLEGASREEDHRHFLRWLKDTLVEQGVDVLLVAGDVFDSSAPSAEAQAHYYRFLHSLSDTPLKQVVVVGGNHDSATRLDAPRELLAHFDVHVVGGVDGSLERCLCPVYDDARRALAVILAVPFVHEWRLGYRGAEGDVEAQRAALGTPFRVFYEQLTTLAVERFPGVPLVATGHLACVGSGRDEAPEEIHLIGSLGGLPSSIFDPRLAFVALGHIHRAYRVGETCAFYAGSPIALNVKEGRAPRTVNLVDLNNDGQVDVQRLVVPGTRQVLEIKGTLEEVMARLGLLEWSEAMAPMLKVELQVEANTPGLNEECRRFVESLEPRPILVGLSQTLVRRAAGSLASDVAPRLADLSPREVFALLCEARGESFEELRGAFEALLTEEAAP